jgi:hypothetical protein
VTESIVRVSDERARSTDIECLERAIAAGELEACHAELDQFELPALERAKLFCRLGEAFYYRGQVVEAVDCAHAAFDLEHCPAIADFCAWLFSNCGHHRAAAAAYRAVQRS